MSSNSGPAFGSLLASGAGIGSAVGALGGSAGFLIFVPFALLDPSNDGGSNGVGLAVFAVFIAMAVGAVIGLVLGVVLVTAMTATDLMSRSTAVFIATAGLVSGVTMVAWSADLSVVSQLAVGVLSCLASGRIAQLSVRRTDIDGAGRAAQRRHSDDARGRVSRGSLLIAIVAVVPVLSVAAFRSSVSHGFGLGVGWVDLTWWARGWGQLGAVVDDLRWWLYLAAFVPAGSVWTGLTKRPKQAVARLVLLAIVLECLEASLLWQRALTGDVVAALLGSGIGALIATRRSTAPDVPTVQTVRVVPRQRP